MRAAGLLLGLVVGCAASSAIPEPDLAMSAKAGVAPEVLREDRAIYAARCGGCHRLYPPAAHRAPEWASIVERMKEYAPIDAEETRRILRYLDAAAMR